MDPGYEAISKAKRQEGSGNPAGAAETLENYLKENPHDVKARLQLAHVYYYGLGNEGYGDFQMEIIFDLEPDNIDALKAYLVRFSKNKKNNESSNEKYKRLLELAPDSELHNAYAMFLRKQMLDFKGSAEHYEMAIALSPRKPEYHQNYAVLLLNDLKDYIKAKEEMETVLELDPGNISVKKNLDLLMRKKFDSSGNLAKKRFGFGR